MSSHHPQLSWPLVSLVHGGEDHDPVSLEGTRLRKASPGVVSRVKWETLSWAHNLTHSIRRFQISHCSLITLLAFLNFSFSNFAYQQTSQDLKDSLRDEIINYDFKASFFDIFVSILMTKSLDTVAKKEPLFCPWSKSCCWKGGSGVLKDPYVWPPKYCRN